MTNYTIIDRSTIADAVGYFEVWSVKRQDNITNALEVFSKDYSAWYNSLPFYRKIFTEVDPAEVAIDYFWGKEQFLINKGLLSKDHSRIYWSDDRAMYHVLSNFLLTQQSEMYCSDNTVAFINRMKRLGCDAE